MQTTKTPFRTNSGKLFGLFLLAAAGLIPLTAWPQPLTAKADPPQARAGSVDLSFDPGTGTGPYPGAIYNLLLQPDGKMLISGYFQSFNGTPTPSFGRLNADGSVDQAFNSGVIHSFGTSLVVLNMALQPDGKILINGKLMEDGRDTKYLGMVRLEADGSVDPYFTTPTLQSGWSTLTMAVQPDGKILVGGRFSTVNGVTRPHLARLYPDGELDESFVPPYFYVGDDFDVMSLGVQRNGQIIVGGDIYQQGYTSYGLMRLNPDGSLDRKFSANVWADGIVFQVCVQPDDKILVGRGVTAYRQHQSPLARLNPDGTLDPSFHVPDILDWNRGIALAPDGKVAVSTTGRLALLNPDGTLNPSFQVEFPTAASEHSVYSMAVQPDGRIIVAGCFKSLNGVPVPGLARLEGELTPIAPVIYSQFADMTNGAGQTVAFTISAAGTWPLSYQWLFNGVPIPNANTAMLVLNNLMPWQAGAYSVILSNVAGVAVSQPATLTIPPTTHGSLDRSFDPTADGELVGLTQGLPEVRALAFQYGQTVVYGSFVGADGIPRAQLARLKWDGRIDHTFQPPASLCSSYYGSVSLAPQSDGKLLIALDGRLVRLNLDGSLDDQFAPALPAPCSLVAVRPDGKLVIAGGGDGLNYVDRLNADGSRDTSFQRYEGANFARALAVQPDGIILVAGEAGSSGQVAWLNPDGTLNHTLQAEVAGEIHAVAPAGEGKVVIGGTFWQIDNRECPGVARLNIDGTLDTTFNPRMPSVGPRPHVHSLAVKPDGRVIIGGVHPKVYPGMLEYSAGYLLILQLNADGGEDPNFTMQLGELIHTPYSVVRGLAVDYSGEIVACGSIDRRGVVRLYQWGNPVESFMPNLQARSGVVMALSLLADGKALVQGQFEQVAGAARPQLARLNANGILDNDFTPVLPPDCSVWAHAVQPDGKLLVSVGYGEPRVNELLRLNADGSGDPNFHPAVRLGAGSSFIERLFVLPDGRVLIGGAFDSVNNVPRRSLARLNGDGSLDVSFNAGLGLDQPGSYARLNALLAQPDGRILVGGNFQAVNGVDGRFLARLNVDGSVDETFYADYFDDADLTVIEAVDSLALQPDGRILVGLHVSTFPQHPPALLRLNADGQYDPTFNVGAGVSAGTDVGYIAAILVLPDGKILAGGGFDTYNEEARPNLVRLYPNGQVDPDFNVPWSYREGMGQYPSSIGAVSALALQRDGRILVGGWFESIAGEPRWGIARLHNDASLTGSSMLSILRQADKVHLRLEGWPGKAYVVESSTDLANWTSLVTVTMTGETALVPVPANFTEARRFYRARLVR